jgi:hypothetical protein
MLNLLFHSVAARASRRARPALTGHCFATHSTRAPVDMALALFSYFVLVPHLTARR